jgi:hypothetical protein
MGIHARPKLAVPRLHGDCLASTVFLLIRQVLIPRFPTLNNSAEIARAMARKHKTDAIIAGD